MSEKDLEKTIESLQEQMLRLDKLASLGTLSAGVAHEIRNPLNFVINFGQMANDLVDDMEELLEEKEIKLDDKENDELAITMRDLRSTLAKIVEHGQRASDIVNGILHYARGKTDEYLPTQINPLLKKYVWLSFHAMRMNLENFNVTIHEEYDPSIPEVKIIPQDISRAIINLMNNACYAVWEKDKSGKVEGYVPTITVKTMKKEDEFLISIEDNGTGMTAEVKQKVFDLYFSTKPAGQGTGLGMSITREIIEKKHGGRLDLESVEGQYTRFTMHIPMK